MNISKIRQMAVDGDMSVNALRYLIDCHGECEHLDYKENVDLGHDHGCASFAKDVIAMKNVGGGYLVIGVRDKTWTPVGIAQRLAYDTKAIRDKVRKATALDLDVDIVQHEIHVSHQTRIFALVLVRSATKLSKLRTPSLVGKDFYPREDWGLRQGEIYIRNGDSTQKVRSGLELQNLLDDLQSCYQEQELETANTLPSPFAVESGLFRLLPREYSRFVGREQYKHQIREAVESDPRIWIVNLYGPGGVGKSALATWLAYEYYDSQGPFEAVLQLSAKDLELSTTDGFRHLRPTLVSLEDLFDRILHLFQHDEFCQEDIDQQKRVVTELLSSFRTLLILDNMETVRDGRIMDFVKTLPASNRTKVLLTSRRRTSGWEYPVQVSELSNGEVTEFLSVKVAELGLRLPLDDQGIYAKFAEISGGLPLAIQWILGEYARTGNLSTIMERAVDTNSPLLEFSFRNSWYVLDVQSQQAMAILTIFDEPPTINEWRIALDWPIETMEKAATSLAEVTFVTEHTDQKTGHVTYSALPITLTFARNELAKMGRLEAESRLRYQGYRNRMQLASVETAQYEDLFERFDAASDNQKRAIILCRIAEGQARSLMHGTANETFKQALDLDPRSVYALVSYGVFKMELKNYGEAEEFMRKASQYCNKKTGFYVYYSLSKLYDQTADRPNKIRALQKALEYKPRDTIARHSLGVAFSQSGDFERALEMFNLIINEETSRPDGPSESLVYAYKTKIITLRRAKRPTEAELVLNEARTVISNDIHLRYRIRDLEDLG